MRDNNLPEVRRAMSIPSCPLGDRHGIDLLNTIHTQLGVMSTQLTHVMDTSDAALVSIRQSDERIDELKFTMHTITQEVKILKETQINFRNELDTYRKGVFASAVACLFGLVGLIGASLKDHFGIIFK